MVDFVLYLNANICNRIIYLAFKCQVRVFFLYTWVLNIFMRSKTKHFVEKNVFYVLISISINLIVSYEIVRGFGLILNPCFC